MWFADTPKAPAIAPEWMSFSALVAMESCPRQWSLSRSSYPQVWNGYGYPTNPTMATLAGQVVHRSIERLVRIVVSSNISSLDDPSFVQMMRELGGYPSIIETEIERIDEELAKNPRLALRHSDLKAGLLLRTEALREAIQLLLSDLEIQRSAEEHGPRKHAAGSRVLKKGHYSEIELRSAELGWYGKVDYLKVLDDGCEIFDFKTGEEKPEHELQMNIYDLLWAYDKERNAGSLPLKSKTLIYPSRTVNVPLLSASELEFFSGSVSNRSSASIAAISAPLPVANVAISNCSYCSVRQLCTNYWKQTAQDALRIEQGTGDGPFTRANTDLEVRLVSSISSRVWKARVVVGMFLDPDTEILIHFGDLAARWSDFLIRGSRVRLLNVFIIKSPDDDEELSTRAIGIKPFTELFVVREGRE
jgi:hypothetical protein